MHRNSVHETGQAGLKSQDAAAYETLRLSQPAEGVLLVALNRPDVRNALNTQMGRDLCGVFGPMRFSPGDLRCVVVTGSGEKAFCAGGDLKERDGMDDAAWRLQHAIFEQAFYAIMDSTVPVIAAVNGAAYGGGCELALACDFAYASMEARFALTEVTIGLIPGVGGTQNLPRAVGERRAKELILSGRPFSSADALEWGMINAVFPADALLSGTLETASLIAANAPIAVRQAKLAIHRGLQGDLRTGLVLEVNAYERVLSSADRREGVAAFVQKRRPAFKGS